MTPFVTPPSTPITGCGLTGAILNVDTGALVVTQLVPDQAVSPPSNPVVTVPTNGFAGGVYGTPPSGLTLNLSYTAQTTLAFGTTNATALIVGNSGSTTNIIGSVQAGGTAAVSCPSGVTAGTMTVKNGIVTHC